MSANGMSANIMTANVMTANVMSASGPKGRDRSRAGVLVRQGGAS
jgi:hypothetical protein